jgi:hypothetical protein
MLLVLTFFYLFVWANGQMLFFFSFFLFFFFETLRYNATNQHFVEVANGFSLLAHLLERVSPTYLTSETVTAVVNVCARVRFSESYVNKAMTHLLTNLRLWLFTPLPTQLHVFKVISYEINANVARFRSSDVLGVPRLLAAVRDIGRCDTCWWWYSLCNFQYRPPYEQAGPGRLGSLGLWNAYVSFFMFM